MRETARKCPKTVAPATITRIMQLMRVVSKSAATKSCQLRLRRISATASVAQAPTAPASVGVKMPPKSPPMTRMKITSVSAMPLSEASFSRRLELGPRGPSSGRSVVQMRMLTTKSVVSTTPGRSPAMKSSPMDCSVRMP